MSTSSRALSNRVHKRRIWTALMLLTCVSVVLSRDTRATGSMNPTSLGELVLTNDSMERNIRQGETLTLVCEKDKIEGKKLNITWYKNGKPIATDEVDTALEDTLGLSKYVLQGSQERGPVNISCKVFRPPSPDYIDFKSTVINFLCSPQPEIIVARGSDSNCEVDQGKDFTFKCDDKKGYPETPVNYSWYHNDQLLEGETEYLELKEIKWDDAGDYACHMNNTVEGRNSSTMKLTVKHIPVCREATPQEIYFDQERNITCDSVGYPPLVKYRWQCEENEKSKRNEDWFTVTSNKSTTCKCWGINDLGTQETPCIYHMERATLPDPVSNCSMDEMQMLLSCDYESENNLTESFILQFENNGTIIYNETSTSSNFSIPERLKDYLELSVTVYTVNAFGNSSFKYNTTNCCGGPPVASPNIENTVIITVVIFIALLLVAAAIYLGVKYSKPSNNQRKPRLYGEDEDATPPLEMAVFLDPKAPQ